MAADDYGYIRVSRKLYQTDRFWLEPRVFSRHEAWEDFIQMAAWGPTTRLIGNTVVELNRGEVLASRSFLAKRWKWGQKRVRLWLELVTEMGRIRAEREASHGTVYLLVNYDEYQDAPAKKGQAKGQTRAKEGPDKGQGGARIEVREYKGSKEKQLLPLPDTWRPNDKHRSKAKDMGVDCDREAARMRDWAAAKGEKAKDWDARFRLWLDRATPNGPGGARKPAQTEDWEYRQPLPHRAAS